MRRLFRCAFNGTAGLSMVACAAILVMWVESYRTATPDVAEFLRHGERWSIDSYRGRVRLSNDPQRRLILRQKTDAEMNVLRVEFDIETFGNGIQGVLTDPVALERREREDAANWKALDMQFQAARAAYLAIVVPPQVEKSASYGLLAIMTLILPATFVVRRLVLAAKADARSRLGLCSSCGYDLRATTGRCPECGAIPVAEGVS